MKQPSLIQANPNHQSAIEHLWPFYVYDLTRYCGQKPGWQNPTDLSFTSSCVKDYFEDPNSQIFLVKVDDEFAGFVMVKKPDFLPEVDWFLSEFYITSKFQRNGFGQAVAIEMFNGLKGEWALGVLPENIAAYSFWRKTLSLYTNNQYREAHKTKEELKTPLYPEPYPMNFFIFSSKT
jgi:predicted acetyltransferase